MRNYRDLVVLQKAHQVTLHLYKVTRRFPKDELFGLTSQIRRAAASIGANLAEGCGRQSDPEFGRFLTIAMGSASELSYHLLLAKDLALLPEADYAFLNTDVDEVRKMLTALTAKVKRSDANS